MPILYPIAALYYLVTYWMDKWLMLNFYRRSISFNEDVPVQSLSLFKYPILIHGIVSIGMLSNSQFFFEGRTTSETSEGSATVLDYYKGLPEESMGERLNKEHTTIQLAFYSSLVFVFIF